jgi:hypothetical protein
MRFHLDPARSATLILVVAMTCCAPYRVDYVEDSLRDVSQAEVVHKLGYPQRLKRAKNGDQVWEYDFQGKENECVTYVVTFTPENELRQWERRDCPQEGRRSKSRQ